jgi:hypothetical protein
MPVDAFCNDCESSYRVSRKMEGKLVKCPACGRAIRVPLATPSLASIAADHAAGRRPARPAPPAAKPPSPPPKPVTKPVAKPDTAPPKAPVKTARPAPAKPRKPAPPPEPDDGAYDLADLRALAAAETAAEAIEERVYIPAPVIEKPEPRRERPQRWAAGADRSTARRSHSDGPELSVDALFIRSPMFYFQVLAVVAAVVGVAAGPLVLAFAAVYILILWYVTFFVAYFKALIVTGTRWPIAGLVGIVPILFIAFFAYVLTTQDVDLARMMLQYNLPVVAGLSFLGTLLCFLIMIPLEPRAMVRPLIAAGYFVGDYVLLIGVGVGAMYYTHFLPHR